MVSDALAELIDEIGARRKDIHTDSYPMSIGEVINMYRDADIDIHPDFQREFRWSDKQRTRFIESILLGLPLPSFFVVQREDGVWDVIDGLQRLSTILSFVGELQFETDEGVDPLVLHGTHYLPSLEGVSWDDGDKSFTETMKRDFKREKLTFQIIKKESDSDAKYELFQRLNTGGSVLSPQELRNCLLLMLDKKFYTWFRDIICTNQDFLNCLPLTERQIEEKYHMELALRFLVLQSVDWDDDNDLRDVNEFITEQMRKVIVDYDYETEEADFKKTFQLLNAAIGEDSFRRYNHATGSHTGPFSLAVFEVVAFGLVRYCDDYGTSKGDTKLIREKAREVGQNRIFIKYSGSGVRARSRLPKLIP
ncbi:MAG: DUF262 domain-containing protein [Erysipelotrichaceae bacterium]|nr:DUF262 domain-containing protein [Erysipelotrichaceae bacterium]